MLENIGILLLYLSIPISSGVIGWGTNVLAIKMTFYPLEFRGIRPLGWQGIIPSKARKIAEKSVDLLTTRLLKIEERFAQIKPEQVAQEMNASLDLLSQQIMDEVMEAQFPLVWKNTPKVIKKQLYENLRRELPQLIRAVMEDIKADIHSLLDLKVLGVNALTQNKSLLNQVFLRCGYREFKFIERSGLYFGIPFGMIQMIILFFYTPWWLLPLFGLMVGYITNWLAIRLIFKPAQPRSYFFGLIVLQGLFIRRQSEVAKEYANLVADQILTMERMFDFILRGPGAEQMARIVQQNIEKVIDQALLQTQGLMNLVVKPKQLAIIKNIACYRLMQELPIYIRDTFAYTEQALDMENMLEEKMNSLSEVEFERILRPAFQEDEWILIVVGAALGLLAGSFQYFLLFSS